MGRKNDPIVSAFAHLVLQKIKPCKIILFGSRARGKAKKDSDYDFLLISPKFKKWEWEERATNMYRLKRNIPAAMDILCLTPSELAKKKKEINIVNEALKEGIEIKI